MPNRILSATIRGLVGLRYRIRVSGLDAIARRGRTGIVFLPNHPALIDPVIMLSRLLPQFAPRALADAAQVDRPIIRGLARRVGVRAIPDMSKVGVAGRERVEAMLAESIAGLKRGENLLMYPAGRVYRRYLEDLGGNSAVETILGEAPGVRVVLVRTRGLWGSSLSWASGQSPKVGQVFGKAVRSLLLSGMFFAPRREVTIEFVEPDDLPRTAGRAELNRYLERFYNEGALHNTYVPYTHWESGGVRQLPEPQGGHGAEDTANVPAATRELVTKQLKELSGVSEIADGDRLANDLGLDSLSRAELSVWIEKEFGFPQAGPDSLQTVADVLLAACGEAMAGATAEIVPPPAKWFKVCARPGNANLQIGASENADQEIGVPRNHAYPQTTRVSTAPLALPSGDTITEVFLNQARATPTAAVLADQTSGVKTYRDVVTAAMVLQDVLRRMPGEYLGIMLPASVAANLVYLAALFAGKTPVMVNWTVGPRNLQHSLELLGVQRVVTAGRLLTKLAADKIDLSAIDDRFFRLESLKDEVSLSAKLRAAGAARLRWRQLEEAEVSPTAVVLFTSGSEAMPKAVPLTHANILTNLRDALAHFKLKRDDCLLGMLPPFHSFGLTATTVLPLVSGLRCCYWPNPNDRHALAQMIDAYKVSLLIGTPTFVGGIVRAASARQLASLRLALTGAEKCPPRVYDDTHERCPQLVLMEGYGITECSPIVAANDPEAPVHQSIGKVMRSVEYAIVDEDAASPRRVPAGQKGMLLVRGPSIFGGYLKYDGPSPFVEFEGKPWYRTGDLVMQDADGVLTFIGRLKRFVKLGGEMVSLPAIEAVLEEHFAGGEGGDAGPENAAESPSGGEDWPDANAGPSLAVETAGDAEHPELVLFTRLDISREDANRRIATAGLSPLHNIRRVVRLERLPVLGTGKTDYRTLREML